MLDPNLKLSPETWQQLTRQTKRVIHSAASVMFNLTLKEARKINVGGTKNILRFAEAAHDAGALERFDYFGTTYVAGSRVGRILEDAPVVEQKFNNTYERTKAEAELVVREAAKKIPLTIFRPSIIVGNSRDGFTSGFTGMYIPLKIYSANLVFTAPALKDGIIDLIPVDYVVDAIEALAAQSKSIGQCYHIAAGPEYNTTVGEILDMASEIFKLRGRPFYLPIIFGKITVKLLKLFVWYPKRRRALNTVGVFLPYLGYKAEFDTSNRDRDIEGTGVHVPDAATFLRRLMEYCRDSDWGKKPIIKK